MLKSLDELAVAHDQIAPNAPDGNRYKWPHRIAALVHGWTQHNYHYEQNQVMLSDADYLAALELAKSGSIAEHPAAVAVAPLAERPPEPVDLDNPPEIVTQPDNPPPPALAEIAPPHEVIA